MHTKFGLCSDNGTFAFARNLILVCYTFIIPLALNEFCECKQKDLYDLVDVLDKYNIK